MLYSRTICGEIKNPSQGIQFGNAGTQDALLVINLQPNQLDRMLMNRRNFMSVIAQGHQKSDGIDIQLYSSVYLKKSYSSSLVCYIFCMPYFDCSVTYYP